MRFVLENSYVKNVNGKRTVKNTVTKQNNKVVLISTYI